MRIKITTVFDTERDSILKGKSLKEINKLLMEEALTDPAIISSKAEIS
jgi:hypothetical protein